MAQCKIPSKVIYDGDFFMYFKALAIPVALISTICLGGIFRGHAFPFTLCPSWGQAYEAGGRTQDMKLFLTSVPSFSPLFPVNTLTLNFYLLDFTMLVILRILILLPKWRNWETENQILSLSCPQPRKSPPNPNFKLS